MWNVESWLDELRELVAMGEQDLPPAYKISALKLIATDRIKEQIDLQKQKMAGKDPETKYEALRDIAKNMSRSMYVEQRDSKKNSNAM